MWIWLHARPLALQDVKTDQDLSRTVCVVVSVLLGAESERGGILDVLEAREASQRSAIPAKSAVLGTILTAILKA